MKYMRKLLNLNVYLKVGSEKFTDLQVWSPDTGTFLRPHHLLPQLGEEFALAVAREEAVLDLGEHGVGVRLAVALLPHQTDPHTVIDVEQLRCEPDGPAARR